MCVINDASARRRHRAVYLAPSRTTLPTTIQDEIAVDSEQPQAVLESTTSEESPPAPTSVCKTVYSFLVKVYSTFKDFILVMVVIILSFFLYDVDVSIVKADQTAAVPLGDSSWTGRVVIQSQEGQIRRQLQTSVV
jgi:hypothetical protein